MIIGIDASRANHEQKTGVEWYAYFLIREFMVHSSSLMEQDVEFVLYTDKPLQGELAKLPEGWSEKVLHWPLGRFWTQIRMSWEMFRNPPDVLFIPAHVFPIIHPKKTVMTVHDVAATRFPESYNWFERWYSVWSARYAVKKLWKVVVPSEFTKNELTSDFRLQTSGNISVVHHGYDEKYRVIEDKINIRQILDKYSIAKPFVMSIGRLEHKKNTLRIVEAFEKVKSQLSTVNCQLLLIGKSGFGYSKIKSVIDNSQFKSDIIAPGWVDEEDIPILMNAAEVFVFPSLYEGFGIPVLEALACRTPVVASRGSSLEEVGGDCALYVDPEKPEEIANAIIELMQNDKLRMKKVELGMERVKEFSWEKCAKETLDILLSRD